MSRLSELQPFRVSFSQLWLLKMFFFDLKPLCFYPWLQILLGTKKKKSDSVQIYKATNFLRAGTVSITASGNLINYCWMELKAGDVLYFEGIIQSN